MNKRGRIIGATALGIVGLAFAAGAFNPGLNAAGVADTGVDLTKYFVWGGVGALVLSALLFISASSE